jgi:hypothetical protein
VELTRRQGNEIFEVLKAHGIDLNDCKLDPYETSPNPLSAIAPLRAVAGDFVRTGNAVRHMPTNSTFIVLPVPKRYHFEWHVHQGPNRGPRTVERWADLLEQVGAWAQEIRYVVETPNLWEELKGTPQILTSEEQGAISYAPFTPDERLQISARIDQAKDTVRRENPRTDARANVGH